MKIDHDVRHIFVESATPSMFSKTSKAEQWRKTTIINAALGSKIGEPVILVIGYYVWHLTVET